MNISERLSGYVKNKNYEGLINLIAKKLRVIKADEENAHDCLTIRVLSEFGLFLLKISEHPLHDFGLRREIFKMARKIDDLLEGRTNASMTFIYIMAKISNYAFKIEYATKRGLETLEDINTYIDEV